MCDYVGCNAEPDVERVHIASGDTYAYCENHDPLQDDDIAHQFVEVGKDG